jgi:hypothetical protein
MRRRRRVATRSARAWVLACDLSSRTASAPTGTSRRAWGGSASLALKSGATALVESSRLTLTAAVLTGHQHVLAIARHGAAAASSGQWWASNPDHRARTTGERPTKGRCQSHRWACRRLAARGCAPHAAGSFAAAPRALLGGVRGVGALALRLRQGLGIEAPGAVWTESSDWVRLNLPARSWRAGDWASMMAERWRCSPC